MATYSRAGRRSRAGSNGVTRVTLVIPIFVALRPALLLDFSKEATLAFHDRLVLNT
jgi:hypothetical protein